MDQLRIALRWLKAQHFWVLTILAVIVATTCWYVASGKLISEFKSNKQQIVAQFSAQSSLRQQAFHPNEQIIESQQSEIAKLAASVQAAWQQLYDRQREEVLIWPAELKPSFREYIEEKNFEDAIRGDMLEEYQNYARKHFPELPKIIDAKELKAGQQNTSTPTSHDWDQYLGDDSERGRTARSEAGDVDEDQDFIVIWLDQGRIREELAWERRPSSMRVWVTQEDLWVYHALLRAIANTNKAKGADRFANAAIRGIEALQVGQPAGVQSRSQGKILAFEAESQPSMDGESGEPFDEGMAGEDSSFDEGSAYDAELGGETSSDGKSSDAALLSQRYLDAQGRPLAGGPNAGVEFKRLPVRMVLFMDQRWLTHFLAECANAPLPVEVQEVHINPQGQGGGSRYSGGDFSGSRGGTGQLQVDLFERNPNLVRVVIQGIVYIYNKPNSDILQVADASSEP